MEATPRTNSLYRQIAKDYNPKEAEMKICKYIQGMEERLEVVEKWMKDLSVKKPTVPPSTRSAKVETDQ